jgi:hypothetical protein
MLKCGKDRGLPVIASAMFILILDPAVGPLASTISAFTIYATQQPRTWPMQGLTSSLSRRFLVIATSV